MGSLVTNRPKDLLLLPIDPQQSATHRQTIEKWVLHSQLVPKATNLPAAWTVAEDARLLLAAQRMGYYPNNGRRQIASDGFLAKFMNLYTPVRVHTPDLHPHLFLPNCFAVLLHD